MDSLLVLRRLSERIQSKQRNYERHVSFPLCHSHFLSLLQAVPIVEILI